jgi:hypothetical protein
MLAKTPSSIPATQKYFPKKVLFRQTMKSNRKDVMGMSVAAK